MQTPLDDPALLAHRGFFLRRRKIFEEESARIKEAHGSLKDYADLHLRLGIHSVTDVTGRPYWRLLECMPNASGLWLATSRTGFALQDRLAFSSLSGGMWELLIPKEELTHGEYYELRVRPKEGGEPQRRVPAFADYVEQDKEIPEQWCARFFNPETPYVFQHDAAPRDTRFPRIYEAHVGMAQPSLQHVKGSVGTYADFARNILPRIRASGYTAVQLMAIPEHPLYRSFGYQVGSYFAPSSRYGTPDDFRRLVDEAHRLGLSVILDVAHGHACSNTEQGLARYDTGNLFFSEQDNQWGTPSFAFDREPVRRFLLSNCRYWLEEFHVDGFRFDAVGNIIYADHGINDDFQQTERCFTNSAGEPRGNVWGELYLSLANELTHTLHAQSITIAEEFSGMPGLTCQPRDGGLGFDYRFAMGQPDFWGKAVESPQAMGLTWYEMTNHRPYDRTISYVECHDQCINGGSAMIWRLLRESMYTGMQKEYCTWKVSRGLAFYRLMRALTLTSADAGYLNFMGNEFGHPEWLDDEACAHRQWHLADSPDLLYAALARWDRAQLCGLVQDHLEDFLTPPIFRFIHEDKRLLAFERGHLLFAFNFHELDPQIDLRIPATPGKYVELFSSDEERFGGYGNLAAAVPPTEHFSDAATGTDLQDVTIYLPPMTMLAMVRR
ncbi:MAG: alpha amylase C-terminal domain-containing protein [Desulfovibrionaceae bacterium]|nr:alpha amylase C-terminal domain-containing protein [Desulfovibrionaceae bacterium]